MSSCWYTKTNVHNGKLAEKYTEKRVELTEKTKQQRQRQKKNKK